jgi:5-methyltetrahydropteroyltriglutamate--homocysteine methyltransferase
VRCRGRLGTRRTCAACRCRTASRSTDFIRRALKHIEPERLILTSDCGFGRQSMSRMHATYKMIALVRGANIVRTELGLPESYIPATDPQLSMAPLTKG